MDSGWTPCLVCGLCKDASQTLAGLHPDSFWTPPGVHGLNTESSWSPARVYLESIWSPAGVHGVQPELWGSVNYSKIVSLSITYCSDDESWKQGCMRGWHNRKKMDQTVKKKNCEKWHLLYYNIPVHTHKPTVQVHSMSQCAEIYYCTCTHAKPYGGYFNIRILVASNRCRISEY